MRPKVVCARAVPAVANKSTCRLQVARDLSGVMRIGVVHPHTGVLTLEFHAPSCARERTETSREILKRESEFEPSSQSSGGVQHIVAPWDLQGHAAECFEATTNLEGGRPANKPKVGRLQVCPLALPH